MNQDIPTAELLEDLATCRRNIRDIEQILRIANGNLEVHDLLGKMKLMSLRTCAESDKDVANVITDLLRTRGVDVPAEVAQ